MTALVSIAFPPYGVVARSGEVHVLAMDSMAKLVPLADRPMTVAEIEAEAERARDQSRREAERILEAEQRRRVEDRVKDLIHNAPLTPPPPPRSQTLPPSPTPSQKEGLSAWWTAAKNKLSPSKDLTPAQQIIQEARAREKEEKRTRKDSNKSLAPPSPKRVPVPAYNASPTQTTPGPTAPPKTAASPNARSASPHPLYASFTPAGSLDIPATLITIARRFEKLERWTVGHVRALEERMSDVEQWLVEHETSRDVESTARKQTNSDEPTDQLQDIKDGLHELQTRVSVLGREVARLASRTSESLSLSYTDTEPESDPESRPVRERDSNTSPPPFAYATPIHRRVPSMTARESTSPPLASKVGQAKGSSGSRGTRLPYPTGDYAPPPSGATTQSPLSPTSSITSATRAKSNAQLDHGEDRDKPKHRPISGLPSTTSPSFSQSPSPSPIPQHKRPPRATSPRTSPSPTPRKRYTVALGGPLVPPPDFDKGQSTEQEKEGPRRSTSPLSYTSHTSLSTYGNSYASGRPRSALFAIDAGVGGEGEVEDDRDEDFAKSEDKRKDRANGGERERGDEGREGGGKEMDKEREFEDETIGKSSTRSGRYVAVASFNSSSNTISTSTAGTDRAYKRYTTSLASTSISPISTSPKPLSATSPSSDSKSLTLGATTNTTTSSTKTTPTKPPHAHKPRAQSVYNLSSMYNNLTSSGPTSSLSSSTNLAAPVAPLNPNRLRSRSTDRFSTSPTSLQAPTSTSASTSTQGKFADPLILRRQDRLGRERERDSGRIAMPRPMGKVPIGDLVAFFDGDRKEG